MMSDGSITLDEFSTWSGFSFECTHIRPKYVICGIYIVSVYCTLLYIALFNHSYEFFELGLPILFVICLLALLCQSNFLCIPSNFLQMLWADYIFLSFVCVYEVYSSCWLHEYKLVSSFDFLGYFEMISVGNQILTHDSFGPLPKIGCLRSHFHFEPNYSIPCKLSNHIGWTHTCTAMYVHCCL